MLFNSLFCFNDLYENFCSFVTYSIKGCSCELYIGAVYTIDVEDNYGVL